MYGIIPSSQNEKVYIFTGDSQGSTGTNCWHAWTKPEGISFIQIICIGAGGGGGGGYLNDSATNRNGAGGGGSGAVTTAILPASLIDDTLYILPGIGGAGANFGTSVNIPQNGSAGTASYVSYRIPSTARQYVIVTASAGGGGGGGIGGTLTAGGAGGSAGSAVTLANHIWSLVGTFKSFAGQAGTAGAGVSPAGTAPAASITPLLGTIVSGGTGSLAAGSAGTNNSAGTILANGILPAIPASGNGLWFWSPLCGSGGSGGNLSAKGGDGAYGCGGGGGGSGPLTGGDGRGGRGGHGLVMLICW